MTKSALKAHLDALVALVGRFPLGADIKDVQAALDDNVARRTVQRRLATLVGQGRLIAVGTGRARKYRLPTTFGSAKVTITFNGSGTGESCVPLSPEAEEIKTYVRQALQQRKPISYQINFLEVYTPNITWYLPQTLRDQLHSIGRPSTEAAPAGTFAREILDRLLIDLSWASSRLEGNTYTRLDTERLIHAGQAAEGKDALETQMILNHKAAIQYLVNNAAVVAIDRRTITALHALLSDGLLADPTACGTLRNRVVGIHGSVYMPIALPQRVEELFGFVLKTAAEITDPFEQAFFLMVHLPYLQPFEDVNKRVSRLAANIPLIKYNLSPLSFLDVPERAYVDGLLGVYEMNRVELMRDVFVWAYERSCQQYAAVHSQLTPPDTFRLRYRTALGEAIRAIVHAQMVATSATIRQMIPTSVAHEDRDKFVDLVLAEFATLHADNAVRFGVHPFEFAAWQAVTKMG
jgi:Fic family protein